jgi:hypothetical protein
VQVFDAIGYRTTARKRRDQITALADVHSDDALSQLRTALATDPGSEPVNWMSWPDLTVEAVGSDGALLDTLGLLYPDYLRWEPHGDMRLLNPPAVTRWLARWAPDALLLWPRIRPAGEGLPDPSARY